VANPFADAEFRWNDWNIAHVSDHGVTPWEAEHIVRHAKPPYPRKHRKGRHREASWYAQGRLPSGETLQVAWVRDPGPDCTVYVIHAMPI
jgi:hypothetical protein